MLLNRIHARNEEIASQAQRHTADRSRHRRSFQTRLWLAGAALCTTLVLVLRDGGVAGRASPLSAPRVRLARGSGGYARYVAICPGDWPHGVSIADAPGAPLPVQAAPLRRGADGVLRPTVGAAPTQYCEGSASLGCPPAP